MKVFFKYSWRGILCALVLVFATSAYADPGTKVSKTQAAANLFLSNFSEMDMSDFRDSYDDTTMVDFAISHQWFNAQDSFEFGTYFDDANCRISDKRVQSIIQNYFYDPAPVDLSHSRFDYYNGYYYFLETGGWMNAGFSHVLDWVPVGGEENLYFFSFLVYGEGYEWNNEVMSFPQGKIEDLYGNPCGYGCALVYATDPTVRSTYRLVAYSRF